MESFWDKCKDVGVVVTLAVVATIIAIVATVQTSWGADKGGEPLNFLPIGEIAAAAPAKWSGFYIGGHGGWANADIDFPGAPAHIPSPVPAGKVSGPPRQSLDGAVIGGQFGYNWQFYNVVLGVEADLSWGNMGGSVRDGNYIVQSDAIDWSGSVRGRVGYSFGRFMPYLTGGMLWTNASRGQSCPDPAAVGGGHCSAAKGFAPYDLNESQIHQGYVWGGGIEYATSERWSVRIEALHADMEEETYTLGPTPSGKLLGSGKIDHDFTVIRAGINFKLN